MCLGEYLLVCSGKLITFVAKLNNRCSLYFPAAIFVLLGRAQIWRPHTEPYKSLLDILANNSSAKNRTNLRLGDIAYLSIFYNISISWLQTFNGFDFSFRWRDSENHQYYTSTRKSRHLESGVYPGNEGFAAMPVTRQQ